MGELCDQILARNQKPGQQCYLVVSGTDLWNFPGVTSPDLFSSANWLEIQSLWTPHAEDGTTFAWAWMTEGGMPRFQGHSLFRTT